MIEAIESGIVYFLMVYSESTGKIGDDYITIFRKAYNQAVEMMYRKV